jgi:hypothetical protein
MTTLMTAPCRTVALDRRMLVVHAKPSAHAPQSMQGGFSTPLTLFAGFPVTERWGWTRDLHAQYLAFAHPFGRKGYARARA